MTAKKPLTNKLGIEPCGRRTHIDVEDHRGWHHIPIEEIRYFEADQKYISVYYPREIVINEILRDLENEFGSMFLRISRSTLASVRYLKAGFVRHPSDARGYRYFVELKDIPRELLVSRRLVRDIQKHFLGRANG